LSHSHKYEQRLPVLGNKQALCNIIPARPRLLYNIAAALTSDRPHQPRISTAKIFRVLTLTLNQHACPPPFTITSLPRPTTQPSSSSSAKVEPPSSLHYLHHRIRSIFNTRYISFAIWPLPIVSVWQPSKAAANKTHLACSQASNKQSTLTDTKRISKTS